jgi:hypothetical protein
MKKNMLLLVAGLMLAALILSACGSGSSSASNFPTGKFTLPGRDMEGLYFDKDGSWYAFSYGMHPAEGTYSVKGDVYTEETNNAGCSAPMKFNYTFDGTNLTFKYVDDPARDSDCAGRYAAFNNVTYVLSK